MIFVILDKFIESGEVFVLQEVGAVGVANVEMLNAVGVPTSITIAKCHTDCYENCEITGQCSNVSCTIM